MLELRLHLQVASQQVQHHRLHVAPDAAAVPGSTEPRVLGEDGEEGGTWVGHGQRRAHLCTSCTKLCVFMKKTSRSAFLCRVAACVSSTLAICRERAQNHRIVWVRKAL